VVICIAARNTDGFATRKILKKVMKNTKVSKVHGMSDGLKLMLNVMAGDTIEISAKAFYNIDNDFPGKSINIAPVIGAAVAALTNPVGTVIGEAKKITDNMNAAASQSTMLSNLPEENFQNNLVQPKSGLNFVLYNSSFDVVEENTGYLPVDDILKSNCFATFSKVIVPLPHEIRIDIPRNR